MVKKQIEWLKEERETGEKKLKNIILKRGKLCIEREVNLCIKKRLK